jgi:hypothetical protein
LWLVVAEVVIFMEVVAEPAVSCGIVMAIQLLQQDIQLRLVEAEQVLREAQLLELQEVIQQV